MAKFSGPNASTRVPARTFGTAPTKTKASAPVARTHNGGTGYTKGDKTALFTMAVTNMVGEATFYESGPGRDNRFKELVRTVTAKDPQWITEFIPFLRDTANMRSASVVVAAEAVKVLGEMRERGEDVDVSVRQIISSACSRADEPAEVLGYWLANYGRKIPMGVKRGLGDAAVRLYNEKSVLKYDGGDRGVRMGDVLNLAHPTPQSEEQSALFTHILDRRHGHGEGVPEVLGTITANTALKAMPEGERRGYLRKHGNEALAEAGYTWEQLSGWLPGGMDAEAWASIIPTMGYMALLRNLRNFEQAGVDKAVLKTVRDKLEDPERVAASRQFPYRFFSAWKATGNSVFFGSALETGLDLSVKNIPAFPGRTLVAIDTSGSMTWGNVSGRSDIAPYEIGALFGAAVAARSENCSVIGYDSRWETIPVRPSILQTIDEVRSRCNGGGTYTWRCVSEAYKALGPFDRICVLTDMQDHPSKATVPDNVPVYVWDLTGYQKTNIDTSIPGRYLLGGFSDAAFRLVPLLESPQNASWPWEN